MTDSEPHPKPRSALSPWPSAGRPGRVGGAGRRHGGAIHWAILAFLLGFSLLLVVLIWYYLIPAGEAARDASPPDKAKLRAVSTLLLAVVLFVLFVGLILTFRVGRFFFPRPHPGTGKPVKTQYVDAWAESAKRMPTPPPAAPSENPNDM